MRIKNVVLRYLMRTFKCWQAGICNLREFKIFIKAPKIQQLTLTKLFKAQDKTQSNNQSVIHLLIILNINKTYFT